MVMRKILAIYAATSVISSCAAQGIIDGGESRRLEIAIGNSDEYASAILTVKDPSTSAQQLPQLQEHDHTRITSILDTTRQMIDTSRELVQNERTLSQGQKMLAQANNLFREVKADILRHHATPNSSARGFDGTAATNVDEERRDLLRKKYSEHDIAAVKENDERSLFMTQDISRKVYETMISFPECLEKLFQNCLDTINSEIAEVGLSTIEVVVHEKRNANQDGYNKVVIVTNELADSVRGRTGNGIVDYPFMFNDVVTGPRTLGVDGKWNCLNMTPEACCETIKSGMLSMFWSLSNLLWFEHLPLRPSYLHIFTAVLVSY